jgi:Fe-Mn family superoxide dismutase
MYSFIRQVIEGKNPKELKQIPLSFEHDELEPVLSEKAIDYHYGKLYKAYVDRYNNGEGDLDFNEAGAYLHSKYFSQLTPTIGEPFGASLEFIETHFKSFGKFKEAFLKTAMSIQGSGWVYLATNGEIKTITNHAIRTDIVLLVDWWEHAWVLDYQSKKEKYLENQWKIINWNVINERL